MDLQSNLKNLTNLDLMRNFNFSLLLDPDYLFDKRPFGDFAFAPHMLLVALLVLLAGFIIWFVGVKKDLLPVKNYYKRLAKMLWVLAAYAGLYVFFRTELVAVLSMRFAMVIWIVLFLAFIVYAIYYHKFKLPGKIEEYWAAKTRAKYSPKKKKK